jgi:hypothetical protein
MLIMRFSWIHHDGRPRLVRASRNETPRSRRYRPRLEGLECRTVLSTLTVLNALDKGAGSLRATIAGATDGDSIVFDPRLSGQTITLSSDELSINKNLDIEGPGSDKLTISGSDAVRVFEIGTGNIVTIAGLTISHGRGVGANKGGGGILNVGSALALRGDVFSNNAAIGNNNNSFGGGALTNQVGATLTVTDCTFVANEAIGTTGGFGEGGAIWNQGSATITGSTFTDNQAIGGDGGKVGLNNNLVGIANGGAIFNKGAGATLTLTTSTLTGNLAQGGSGGSGANGASEYSLDVATGGGITNGDHAILFASGCTFSGNEARGGSHAAGDTVGQGHLGNGVGGGLANLSTASATLTDCSFDHNNVIGGDGNTGGSTDVNVGAATGGAICNGSSGSPATLTASNLSLTDNRAVGGNGNTGSGAFTGAAFGGGLANRDGSTVTLTGSLIADNRVIGGAGAVAFGGGAYNDGQSSLTILTTTICGNQADGGSGGLGEGGGLYLADGGVVCLDTFTQGHTKNNHASTDDDNIFGSFTTC